MKKESDNAITENVSQKYKCPNCDNVFDTAKEDDKNYIPDDDPGYINVDKTGATCWKCGYSSEFAEESWTVRDVEKDRLNGISNGMQLGCKLGDDEPICPNDCQCVYWDPIIMTAIPCENLTIMPALDKPQKPEEGNI